MKARKQFRIFEYEQQLVYIDGGVDTVKEILDSWDAVLHYAFIVHDKDETEPHAHFLVRLRESRDISTIANRLKTEEQYIQKIETSFDQALCYLTHATPTAQLQGKHQYDDSEVTANFAWIIGRDKKLENLDDKRKDTEYLQMLAVGMIKPYEIQDLIPLDTRLRLGRQKISFAVEIYTDALDVDRDMKVIFVTGAAGTGKTTLAKHICREEGLPFFVSGSGADWLDGYQCEPAIILDDARPGDRKFSDWLKLLDNHTASRAWSRYKSKAMAACELMIVTTTLTLEEFISGLEGAHGEDVEQAKRRITEIITLTGDTILYDDGSVVRKQNFSIAKLLAGEWTVQDSMSLK